MEKKTIFISADLASSLIYFLQSDILPILRASDVRIVLFTNERFVEPLRKNDPELLVESLRLDECNRYFKEKDPVIQFWLNFLRRAGGSKRINTLPTDATIGESKSLNSGRLYARVIRFLITLLRNSRLARQVLVRSQAIYTPKIYSDMFEKYQPDLVVASTPGWRDDRYLLREASARGVKTAAVIVGWDNPSSYRLSGARVDHINCWSQVQKDELVLGADWLPSRVNIGGIPSYDGYFRRTWLIPRKEYFKQHGLDPNLKLLSYACSFVSFSPNYSNVETLARIVGSNMLSEPTQLLIRLHPVHLHPGTPFADEAERIHALARQYPNVHVVRPQSLGGDMRDYAGEDMPEKASMMANTDIFLTVYSTMVVEAAIHNCPMVSVCIDDPDGWSKYGQFTLSLREIGKWPTHQRFRQSGAGKVAFDEVELIEQLNTYLRNLDSNREACSQFIQKECTFTDGSAGQRTANYILSLVGKQAGHVPQNEDTEIV